MKKIFLLWLVLPFCVMDGVLAQPIDATRKYVPLVPETGAKQWDTRRDFIWEYSDYQLCWFGDNIELDGVMYRTMMSMLGNSSYVGVQGAFREEDKKVYVRFWSPGLQYFMEEMLYYDFGLQVGDTFPVGDSEITVDSIVEVTMEDGSVRNAIVFNYGWGGNEQETWIEGIGSLAGITHRYDPELVGSFFSHLQCYFEDDNLIWTDGECWDDTEENLFESISLHPNPTNGILYVEAENLQKVEVLNLLGQKVQSQGGSTIDLSGLGNGVYFVKVTDEEGRVEVRKVVKE